MPEVEKPATLRLRVLSWWTLPLVEVAIWWVQAQVRRRRPRGVALTDGEREVFSHYFRPETLEDIRVVREPLEDPWWILVLRRMGFRFGFTLSQAAGITFDQTIVLSPRKVASEDLVPLLFHELVHAVQYRELGIRGFLRDYVLGWIGAGCSYRRIPIEVEAYTMEAEFRGRPTVPFSVEGEVRERLGGISSQPSEVKASSLSRNRPA